MTTAELIIRAYRAGHPIAAICEAAAISPRRLYGLLRRHGVPLRHHRTDLTPRLARLAYEQAGTLRAAAALANVSAGTLRKRMLEADE